jgi:hypothetical protein
MDINYLLKRELTSLMLAEKAVCGEARSAHFEMARIYGRRLRQSTFPVHEMSITRSP